ncbi:MAG: hypothetical protein EB116_12025 [Betaproteobacteria bacterium]|nr:hypothetical protein [Betaproteobacteria bacterium]
MACIESRRLWFDRLSRAAPFSDQATKAAGYDDSAPVLGIAGGPGQGFAVCMRFVGIGAARIENPDGERRQGKAQISKVFHCQILLVMVQSAPKGPARGAIG